MATLTVQQIARTGLAPTYAAAAGGGDQFAWSDKVYFHAKNASGGAITVTFASQYASAPPGYSVANLAVSVPAGGERIIGPFHPEAAWKDSASGRVEVTYSGVTSLTVGAFTV